MFYNFLTNIESCHVTIPALLYYSHIPTAVIMAFLGLFLLIKSKHNKIAARVLFLLSTIFLIWVLFDMELWLTYSSITMMFLWSLFGMLYILMYILGLYFIYVAIEGKDISNKIKYIWGILLLPIIILTPTEYNLLSFDMVNCQPFENAYFTGLQYILGFLLIIWAAIFIYRKYKIEKKENRKKIIFTAIGILLFFITFFWPEMIGSITEDFAVTQYGLFGAPIFAGFLVYSIVRFKTFDIKLLATQALVWALLILIGAEFFFIQSKVNMILTAITLVISGGLGIFIIRSVKKEVALREELEIANNNQQALIHFISHQIKGFFTKSKMIFAGLLEGDFGEVSPTIKEMANVGMASDNNAVAMVQDILKASNLKKGTTDYTLKKLDMVEVVRGVAGSFTEEVNKKGLKLDLNISNTPLMIMADETQITQTIKNLIDNSLRYTPTGEVKISLNISPVNKKKMIFSVKDTGVGLSEGDKSKLFTEGGKGEEAIKVNTNSTGYGLYIVKKIVENHHGRIWAESAGRGYGSKFSFELDLAE